MPERERSREDKCKIFCLYMRPWVLNRADASPNVPALADLGKPRTYAEEEQGKRRRLRFKQAGPLTRNYALAWRQYVRGHVVSKHQRKLIVQFMAANCGKSSTRDAEEVDDAEDTEGEAERFAICLQLLADEVKKTDIRV